LTKLINIVKSIIVLSGNAISVSMQWFYRKARAVAFIIEEKNEGGGIEKRD